MALKSQQTTFYKHCVSICYLYDDKYGIDVDDIYNVDDILDAKLKENIA
jgi:hypothetical protein